MSWKRLLVGMIAALMPLAVVPFAFADLAEIRQRGAIRHLGVPYANFVTGAGDGLDVEIIRRYAKRIGVEYTYVKSSWATVIQDLSGKRVIPKGDQVELIGEAQVRGDIIGNGLTVMAWREKVINFSRPYFPTAIWLVAGENSHLKPIRPSGDVKKDVAATKLLLRGKRVLGIRNTCVDPAFYDLQGSRPVYDDRLTLNDLAAAVIKGDEELTILDVPDTLVALAKFPGKLKVLGTITEKQSMAFGISKDSPELLKSFNTFLEELSISGELSELILEYYPTVATYFPEVKKK